jgi:hypothetical protein
MGAASAAASPDGVFSNAGGGELMRITATGNVGIGTGVLNVGQYAAAPNPGDMAVSRNSAATTGALYFGNTVSNYIYFDGSKFNFNNQVFIAGNCNITGQYQVNGTPISTGGGGISTQNNVTGSRTLGNTYQNTTGKPMFVAITAVFLVGGFVQMKTDSSTTPSLLVGSFTNASATVTVTGTVTGWVLPGNYYSTPCGSYQSLSSWIEWS